MYDEFEKAICKLKNLKAAGIDGIPAEILKAQGHMGKHELFEVYLDIYRKGHWPRDFNSRNYHINRKETRGQAMCGFQDN